MPIGKSDSGVSLGGPDDYIDEFIEESMDEDDDFEDEQYVDRVAVSPLGVSSTTSSSLVVGRGTRGRFLRFVEPKDDSSKVCRKRKKKDRDMSWVVTEVAGGGPVNAEVIPSFGGHIAHRLWKQPQNDRGVIKSLTREKQLNTLRHYKFYHEGAEDMVGRTRLFHLRNSMINQLDMLLISAFVERWQPDTNTFHMPFGEMTILLQDVYFILRIPVDGEVLSCSASSEHYKADMLELFGCLPQDLRKPVAPDNGKKAPLYKSGGVLVEFMMDFLREDRDKEVEAQGYLLYLLGSTLFVDKSGDRVRAAVNLFLKDYNWVEKYAWGAGTLAYLYRQLGIASRADAKNICGCLTFLQAWIYEYFPVVRPTIYHSHDLLEDQPRSLRWDTRGGAGVSSVERLRQYRILLDNMEAEQVVWLPYSSHPGQRVPRSLYTGCIRFSDINEYYDPSRCLRQYGYRQVIPNNPTPPTSAYRPASAVSYDVRFPEMCDHLWRSLQCHSLILDGISCVADPLHSVAPGYFRWYLSISHPVIVNPAGGSSFRRQFLVSREQVATEIVQILGHLLEDDGDERASRGQEFSLLVDKVRPLYEEFKRHGLPRPAAQ